MGEKATPGPWAYWDQPGNDIIAAGPKSGDPDDAEGKPICALAGFTSRPHDFRFIATARNHWTALVDALETAVEALEKHHAWHLDQTDKRPVCMGDTIGQVDADEYVESDICRKTTDALRSIAAAVAGEKE